MNDPDPDLAGYDEIVYSPGMAAETWILIIAAAVIALVSGVVGFILGALAG